MDSQGPLIEARGLAMQFGQADQPALQDVHLELQPGEIVGLAGPDGAGKTTLVRILAGLMQPSEGAVMLAGTDLYADPALAQQSIGYMPQRFGLYEDLTVLENLRLYADLRGLSAGEREESFDRLLGFADLTEFTSRPTGKLSGGMKQKLALACTLINRPKVLLLDEPGVGVDPISRIELKKMVGALADEGHGILWSSAYMDEVESFERILLLNDGAPIFRGPPAELVRRVEGRVYLLDCEPEHRREKVDQLLGKPAVLDVSVQGRAIRLLLADREPATIADIRNGQTGSLVPARPRLEDGFFDILGPGENRFDLVAERYREIADVSESQIVADGMAKSFGDFQAVRSISFDIGRGEIFGLLGPNGAGKSTTFKMLCGLLTTTAGSGSVAGHDLRTSRSDARGALGYMAQKFSLYGDLSVLQNLEFFAGVYGLSGAKAAQRIADMIEAFDLDSVLDQNSSGIPLGFQQRLAFACAVIHEPPVLFLDEPTSGVDPRTRREFWQIINDLVQKGVTVLVTTHFMDEAEYCDRLVLIHHGEPIALGTPDELKQLAQQTDPATPPTMEGAFVTLIQNHQSAEGESGSGAEHLQEVES